VFGIICVEVAKNAAGEICDFDSGADLAVAQEDRSPFSGGRRVLVDHLLTRQETARIALAAYLLAIVSGLLISIFREPLVLLVGLAGIALAWFYYAPPFRLAYRGFGELGVGIAYGPVICCGTYLVQRHALSWGIVWLSVPLGLLIAGFLWVNEFPDYKADLHAGKRNMVVRLGRSTASYVFALILAVAFLLQAFLPALALPRTVWLGFCGLPLALAAAWRVMESPDNTSLIVPAQAWTLQSFVVLALATTVGLLLRP
jgi:1,4-dihydroxy-2-naphthoate octaprenyltransferase